MRILDIDRVEPPLFMTLLETVAKQIEDDENFHPDVIIALSTGGFGVAAPLAKRLKIPSENVLGLPVVVDADGKYRIDDRLLSLGSLGGRRTLFVDDATRTGRLARGAVITAETDHGAAPARSAALIAWKHGEYRPNYVAALCPGEPPDMWWE